jgi:hypothetical protein
LTSKNRATKVGPDRRAGFGAGPVEGCGEGIGAHSRRADHSWPTRIADSGDQLGAEASECGLLNREFTHDKLGERGGDRSASLCRATIGIS